MTLDEAIKHCEEVAEQVRNDADSGYYDEEKCIKCAFEHEQLKVKDEIISKKTLWGMIESWVNMDEYYHDRRPTTIPISEVKGLIEDCPIAGKDATCIKGARLTAEYSRGRNDVINELSATLDSLKRKTDERRNS